MKNSVSPLGMPSRCCSLSKLLNVSSTAWDIFCRVRGVRGGILASTATTSPGPAMPTAYQYSVQSVKIINQFSVPTHSHLHLWPLILKAFSAMRTHMTSICVKFHWNPSSNGRESAGCANEWMKVHWFKVRSKTD